MPTSQTSRIAGTSRVLDEIIQAQHRGRTRGIYSVCSANPWVLEASVRQAAHDGGVLLVESTSNQVNQLGGYTGQTPAQFLAQVRELAERHGLPATRLMLGGDHLGPHPFRKQPASEAIKLAVEMVRAYVAAGYEKIHLDTSMACGGDAVGANGAPDERLAAARAAELCVSAEAAAKETFGDSSHLRYVVGTEVPPPGGEVGDGGIHVTEPADVERTIGTIREAFESKGLGEAWSRVRALVVQPGVDFSDSDVIDYDRAKAAALCGTIEGFPSMVFEAHSTDYQRPAALRELVEDHFAILKVGPWLTYAFREAVFALEMIEREWLGARRPAQLSGLREVMERVMLEDPTHWRGHYTGDEAAMKYARTYSYSDRIRYYWPHPQAQASLERLIKNLSADAPPPALVHQFLPDEYEHLREPGKRWSPERAIIRAVQKVLNHYAAACREEQS